MVKWHTSCSGIVIPESVAEMYHSFDTKIAEECGIPAAILFNHLSYWIIKNQENQKHYHDGAYWTYSSVKALCGMFDYMSRDRIIGGLNALEKHGYIITGNFNEDAKDRTKWYAITEKGYLQLGKSVEPLTENPKCNNIYSTIDTIITDNKTDNIYGDSEESQESTDHPSDDEFFNLVWKLYPKKKGKGSVSKSKKKVLHKIGYEELKRCIERYQSYISQNGIGDQFVMYGSTFFNSGYVDYLDENYDDGSSYEPVSDSDGGWE